MINKYLTKLAKLDEATIRERFQPDLTPEEMQELGVLAKQYYQADPKEHNFFHVDASLEKWPEYWINETAPKGFYQWYQHYHTGVRTEDDLRQMRRWYLFKQRHLGGLRKADPTLQDLSVRPKQRQALLNWGITGGMTKDELIAKAKELEKKADSTGIIQTEHGEKIPYERHKYVEKDWSHLKSPVASNKYDGSHFFLVVQPDGTFKYYSRRESVKGHHPERSAQIPQLNTKPLPQYAGDVMSVELIHTGHNKDNKESHPNVSGILNSKIDRAIATQKEKGPVRGVLLDVKDHNLPTFREKLEYLKKFENDYGNKDVLFMPEFVEGHEAINKYLQEVTKKKSEGIIVTDMDIPEESNVRYKVKNFQTYNLKVSGPLQQEIDIHGNPKDSMGAVPVVDASGRFVGMVGTGFDRATRISAWKNPKEWHDRMIQVKAYPPSKPGGQIRFPIYNGEPDGNIDLVE